MYKFVGARELDLVVLVAITLYLALFSFFLWKKKRSSKSTRRGRGDVSVSFDIPLELQIEIMTRLPPKSLMRFKCVSKLWFSLIRSRYVSNLYLTLASPPLPPRIYVSLVEKHECDSMEVCHDRGKSLLVSFSSSSSYNAESFEQDLTMPGMGGYDMVALRGLILYDVCRQACIYNPATRQSLTLLAVESNIIAQEEPLKYVEYFLGHNPVLDQYKVVCTVTIASKDFEKITSEHWVFLVESGGSWKRIKFNQEPHRAMKPELCINGVVYYLASSSTYNDILVSFDVRCEEFNVIQTPRDVPKSGALVGLIEYGGKPAILDHSDLAKKQYSDLIEYGLMEPWVLEDGGKWSRKSMVLQPRHMHLVENIVGVIVKGTTRNGEVILAPLSEPTFCCILYYDMRKNDLRKVEIRGMPNEFIDPCTYLTLMDKSESIMHLET